MPRKKKAIKSANGEGSVFKDRNRWRWRFPVTAPNGENQFVGGNCNTKEEAQIALVRAKADYSRGRYDLLLNGNTTFREYSNQILERNNGWSANSLQRYKGYCAYINEVLGDIPLKNIQPSNIRDLLAYLQNKTSESSRNRGQPLGRGSISYAMGFANQVFRYAVADELLFRNPMDSIRLPRLSREERTTQKLKAFDRQQAERFVELGYALYECGLGFYWPALYTALSTGMRRGEISALRWEDVDFVANTISIKQQRSFTKKITAPKTFTSRRVIQLPKSVKDLLTTLPKVGESVYSGATHYPDPSTIAHLMRSICLWSDPEQLDNNMQRVKSQVGVPSPRLIELAQQGPALPMLTTHALRHTYATLALRSGVPIEIVSKTLGHSKISMTYDVYRHVLEEEARENVVDLFRKV